jgi:hypothetical protein
MSIRWLPEACSRDERPPSGDGGYWERGRAMNIHHLAMVATKSVFAQ